MRDLPIMIRLTTTAPDFEAAFIALLGQARETTESVDKAVAAIIADVRADGDAALLRYTARFDRQSLTTDRLRITGLKSTPRPPAYLPT